MISRPIRTGLLHLLASARLVLLLAGSVMLSAGSYAQSGSTGPWFGLPLPPPLEPHSSPAIIGERGPVPARIPQGEESYSELTGSEIYQDLETIVSFSHASRADREIGSGQLWGRITGFPSSADTVQWAADQFRAAGIEDVELQSFEQTEDSSFWLPLSWEMKLPGKSIFGEGSGDLVLETAMPLAPTEIEGGSLRAPLVFVGTASPAELMHINVEGRIAVQHVTPQAHMVFERSPTVPRARELFERGALAVVNVIDHPGNERARDFSNCGGPCFNLGGRDGAFLEAVMNQAAIEGSLGALEMELTVDTERRTGLRGHNAIAIIPGRSEESIIINAHADAWFDGAGDNGDGLAVQIALARHFAQAQEQLQRTLVFVASAGHHSAGLHGPRNFVAMNQELARNAELVINVEHVAQRNFSPARSLFEDGYREFIADSGEAPIVAGVSNEAGFLNDLFVEGVQRYGTNFVSGPSSMASGEGGGYRQLDKAIVTLMQAPPLYHTSGEVLETISVPGLERMARFLAYFIKEAAQASDTQLNP